MERLNRRKFLGQVGIGAGALAAGALALPPGSAPARIDPGPEASRAGRPAPAQAVEARKGVAMADLTRRKFLIRAGAGAIGAAALGAAPAAQAAEANERLVAALIGCGGQGNNVAGGVKEAGGVEIAYCCDPDDERARKAAERLGGKTVRDLRAVLDDKAVDAVVIATPDHWHTPAAILALDAGKHVYVEKPCSHNVREGRLLVEAERRAKRVVQHGTQSRSIGLMAAGIELLRRGIIGDVLVAKAYNVQRRGAIGREKPGAPPEGFDYDLWVGPAEMVPFQKNRHHYTWHWWYNFGTGDVGNDGVHEVDVARWGLGVETHPESIAGIGGKYFFDDDQEFPDTVNIAFDYTSGGGASGGDGGSMPAGRRQLVFEMRLWSPYGLIEGNDNGNAFYGTRGWMFLTKRGKLKVYDESNREVPIEKELAELPRLPDHRADFVQAIRKGTRPRADAETGHLSSSLCHLANIAVRLGRSLRFDPKTETIPGDAEASALLSRTYRQGGHWAAPRGA